MAFCDRCNTVVETGGGYCVYSQAPVSLVPGTPQTEIGGMLLCESCANSLFTEKVWREARDLQADAQKVLTQRSSNFDGFQDFMTIMRDMHNFNIALNAKRRGLGPVEARKEAQQIARLWWQDRTAAEKRLSENARKKKRWQFWK